VMHMLDVYPPWNEPMNDASDNLLAFGYRSVYAVIGSCIAARLAPYAPMRHALTLGVVGLVLSTLGAVAAIKIGMGPVWYPIALVVTALPLAWLGGALYQRWQSWQR
ncbi:MAG: hypothetical protein ABI882_24585, partial [Acidobacteriota bacterium]